MNNKFNTNKFGIICSVFQVVLSAVCLIYNIISKADYIIWIIMLCSGLCLLFSNLSMKQNTKK